MTVIKMADVDLANKRVLIREDLNVPIKNGKISSDARLKAALPTLKSAFQPPFTGISTVQETGDLFGFNCLVCIGVTLTL